MATRNLKELVAARDKLIAQSSVARHRASKRRRGIVVAYPSKLRK